MRLKKLEMQGFKSFADKVEMTFDTGVTGVVGPNGSGKSNVADAIRWVLGEQSARSLRGLNMPDVIFSGTEKRRALGYCQVTLLFENADGRLGTYSEVQVTRRLYRSGESEYFLNKTACRLKDIIDLFRDTGIGREGYSLIGQGRVDEILSVKGEERRAVFEEAAGIARFKARKAETEKRLSASQENMRRVKDILLELETQLAPLQKQAQDARKVFSLQEESTLLEMNVFLDRKEKLDVRLADLQRHFAQRRIETKQTEEKQKDFLCQREQTQLSLQETREEIEKKQQEVLQNTQEIQKKEGEKSLLKERSLYLQKEADRLLQKERDDTLVLEENIRAKGNQNLAKLAQNLENLNQNLLKKEEEEKTLSDTIQKMETEAQLLKDTLFSQINARTNALSVLSRLSATREAMQKSLAAQEKEKEEGQIRLAQAQETLLASRKEMQRAQESLETLRRQREERQKKAQETKRDLDQLSQELTKQTVLKQETLTRLELLRTMEREGVQNSVREVLKAFQGKEGVFGMTARLLTVPKEMEVAIETALGGQMQNIVCDKEETAQEMITYLRQNRLGRATFLPLRALRTRPLSPREKEALHLAGCLGVASELISCPYPVLADFLLGRTFLAKDMPSAIAISRFLQQSVRVVTLEGDLFSAGGAMTGGSQRTRMTSLLGRTREITGQEQALAALTQEQEKIKALLSQKQQAFVLLVGEDTKQTALLHEKEIHLARETAHTEHAQRAFEEEQSFFKNRETDLIQLKASIEDTYREEEKIRNSRKQTDFKQEEAELRLAKGEETLHLLQAQREEKRAEGVSIREKAAYARAQLQALNKEEEARNERVQALNQSLAQGKREREENAQMQKKVQEEILHLDKILFEKQKSLTLQKQTLEGENKKALSLQSRLSSLQDAYTSLQVQLAREEEYLRKLEAQLTHLKEEEEELHARLWDRHQATLADALKKKQPNFSAQEAMPRLIQLREEIRAIGAINPNAPEEYENLHTRYVHLLSQHKDLEQAINDLNRIILQLDKQMEKQFLESFQKINDYFAQTFSRLFGGGTAMLRLKDEKDVLHCGIDIIAQPPGKKLQLLSLLSGGERALSAIAILFAMLTLRPSPFCVLDEIEAALDDANIDHFGAYLKEFSKETQFIVITHRKGTMQFCDTLYGVSMEEKGISRMISVRLEDANGQKG